MNIFSILDFDITFTFISLFIYVFQGQSCLRKCSSDEDCKSKKKHCLCDGLCGMSCVKPGKINIIANFCLSVDN